MSSVWDDVTFFQSREKNSISIRLDRDILDFFKEGGEGYQARINAVLKSFVAYQRQRMQTKFDTTHSFEILGGEPFSGTISVGGSALTATYIFCAALLGHEPVMITNVPNVISVQTLMRWFEKIGVDCSENRRTGSHGISSQFLEDSIVLSSQFFEEYFVGAVLTASALLAKGKKVQMASFSTDFFELQFFSDFVQIARAFGVKESLVYGAFSFTPPLGYVRSIELDVASFKETAPSGLTAMVLLFASQSSGETILKNASFSPHIIDFCSFLIERGVEISGVGSSVLKIRGGQPLKSVSYNIDADYLEAQFYGMVAATLRGRVRLMQVNLDYLEPFLSSLAEFGIKITRNMKENEVEIDAESPKLVLPRTAFEIGSYPKHSFHHALLFSVFLSTFNQATTLSGPLYSHPWSVLSNLNKLGLKIQINRENKLISVFPSQAEPALIEVHSMHNYPLSILLGALLAKGKSVIRQTDRFEFLYPRIDKKLRSCGVQVEKLKDTDFRSV